MAGLSCSRCSRAVFGRCIDAAFSCIQHTGSVLTLGVRDPAAVCPAEPEFLFRARELSDLEEALSPSSKALLTSALPALPVLLLGLISLEAKDLVRDAHGLGMGGGGRGGPQLLQQQGVFVHDMQQGSRHGSHMTPAHHASCITA
jgi:hypothetical protein